MKTICHHNDRYNFYCSIGDNFEFIDGLTLDKLTEIVRRDYGQKGIDNLSPRLERAHKRGHSSVSNETLQEFLCCNRAGENEKHLTLQECIDKFLS